MTYRLTDSEQAGLSRKNNFIGMTNNEIDTYSISRLLRGLISGDKSQRRCLEFEASDETYSKVLKKDQGADSSRRVAVPPDWIERDLNVASVGQGGYLTQTTNVGFITTLRNRSVAFRMGAIRLPGLRDDVALTKQTGAASTEWLANEVSAPTESQQSFGQILMTPKIVSAYTEISRNLIKQASPAVDVLVESDLASAVGLATDAAAINGSGALGEPLGILQIAGIHTALGTAFAHADLLECQSDTLGSNALINLDATGYVAAIAVASLFMQRVKFSSTASPLWEGKMADGEMGGFRALSSQQIPAATMLFGDWSQLVIGEWGTLEIEVNPYANFQAGIAGVRAIFSVDVALRDPQSFCAVTAID